MEQNYQNFHNLMEGRDSNLSNSSELLLGNEFLQALDYESQSSARDFPSSSAIQPDIEPPPVPPPVHHYTRNDHLPNFSAAYAPPIYDRQSKSYSSSLPPPQPPRTKHLSTTDAAAERLDSSTVPSRIIESGSESKRGEPHHAKVLQSSMEVRPQFPS